MPWRGHGATHCKRCERPREKCGPISARYLCADCGEAALLENRRELRAHHGPWFRHWRRRCIEALGALPLEEIDSQE